MPDPWGYLGSEPGTSLDPWGYLSADPLDEQVRKAAARHGVDAGLLGAMVHQESVGNPAAVSPKGATGLLQVMPNTARELGYRPEDMTDPAKNLDAGAAYMGQMLHRYGGDRTLALAAYNAGPGAVDKHGGVPPYPETQAYVRAVQAKASSFPTSSEGEKPAQGDPWGYLSTEPPEVPRDNRSAPPPAAPSWSFSLTPGEVAPGVALPSAPPPSDWESTGSPLVQKRRRSDGTYETRPTPRPGQEPAVGVEPEPGVGARLGALANRGITAAGEMIAGVPDAAVAVASQFLPRGVEVAPGASVYPQLGRPGGPLDLKTGREDVRRQYEQAKEALRALPPAGNQPPWAAALADTLAEGSQMLLPVGEGASAVRAADAGEAGVARLAAGVRDIAHYAPEELGQLAVRAKVMPTIPGGVEPFVQPGAVAEALKPEAKILGVGEHATAADQLRALGMRAAPEDAAALARAALDVADSATAKFVPYKTVAEDAYRQIRPVPEPSSLSTGARRLHPDEVPVDLSSLPVQRWRRADDSLTRYGGTFYSPEDSVQYARDADAPTYLTGGQIPETKTLTPQRPAAFIGRPELVARDLYKLGEDPAGMRTMFEKLRKEGHDAAVFFDPREVAPMEVIDLGASSVPRYSPYIADAERLLPKVGQAGLDDALAGREALPHDPWGYLGKPAETPLVRNPPSDEGAVLQRVPPAGGDVLSVEGLRPGSSSSATGRPLETSNLPASGAGEPPLPPGEAITLPSDRELANASRRGAPRTVEPPRLLYHVVTGGKWNGGDLTPLSEKLAAGPLTEKKELIRLARRWPDLAAGEDLAAPRTWGGATWRKLSEYATGDAGQVHLHDSLAVALDFAQEHGGEVLEVDRRGLPVGVGAEYPHPVVDGRVPAASVRRLGTEAPHFAQEPLTTGTTHAITRGERLAADLPEVERLAARESPSWDEAKALYEQDPMRARTLAEEVKAKPRQLTDVENDVLLHDRMHLTLDYRDALAAEDAARQSGDETAAALATAHRQSIEAAKATSDEALDKAGTLWGRAGAARQKLIAEEYSALTLVNRYKAAAEGADVPDAIRQKLADISGQLEQAQARASAAEEKAQQLQASRLIAEEQRQAGKASRSGARTKSRAQLEAEYKDLGAQLRAVTHVQANLNPEQVAVLAHQVRNRVQAGVTNLGELVDTIYTDAKPFISDLEPRDIRDVIAGAGQTPKATRSKLTADLARLKSQSKLLNKLDDVYDGLGLPAAAKRTPPSPEVAALREKLGQVTEDLRLKPPLSDQQRLTRIQRALETKIERVERGTLPVRRARVSSPKIEALRKTLEQKLEEEGVLVGHDGRVKAALASAEERLKAPGLDPQTRELLRGEVDRWKAEMANPAPGRGPLTEAERLAGAKSRTTARIADLEAQIKAGEFPSRGRAPVPADVDLLNARAEVNRLRRQADSVVAGRAAANRTPLQKVLDWTPGWGRFVKLTGVSTLQKLGAAAAERSLLFRPIEELVGAGLSKLPVVKHFAAEAPIEGGGSLSALAKNYAAFFGRQAREESTALLKGGEGPLDLALGKPHGSAAVPSWMDYPGKIHGAIKAPAKVAGYQYAMEKQARWYLARGEGQQLLNPLAQAEMKARAWEYAQRDIFMGDNTLANKISEALKPKPGQTKVTTAAQSAGRVLFPIVKVPTNYALELTDYAAGIPKAAGRIANVISAGTKATPEGAARDIASLVRAGLQEVGPAEAELIMRQLKKGTLGAGLIALGATGVVKGGGYYEPGKHRSPEDLQPGELSIAGMRVPHMILHHPAIEALQIGAEIHRQRQLADGLKNAAKGVGEAVPFFGDYLKDRQDLGTWAGGIERGMTIPPDVQRLARVLDQRGEHTAAEQLIQGLGWKHIDANRRKVRGSLPQRLLKEEELGIPGLRPLASRP